MSANKLGIWDRKMHARKALSSETRWLFGWGDRRGETDRCPSLSGCQTVKEGGAGDKLRGEEPLIYL